MNNYDAWEDRANRAGNSFTRHPIAWIVGIVLLLSVGGFALGFAGQWFGATTDIFRPANVKEQYRAVIEDYRAMEVAAANACGAETAASDENSPTFLEDPAFAYKAQYRHITVDYNRRQNNFFESKMVGPKGYPSTAPTLEEMQALVC